MKCTHKTLLANLSVFLFLFLAKPSFAQYPGMGAVRAMQNQQFMNQQMQMMQMMNMRGVVNTPQEFDFQVTMLDSTKKQITSAIYTDTIAKAHFIVSVDKQYKKSDPNRYKRIYPFQTKSLVCVLIPTDGFHKRPEKHLYGQITDSCWMFKTITGHINAYSVTPNDLGPLDPSTIVGIQLNNGPILTCNSENLKAMVGQNTKALELIADKKYLRAIKKYNRDSEPDAKQ
ncbi:MAG TPA: hypothetical protein VK671_05410 [Mucilaginibacter sp.]|jgi:hypothetical protein|nr:hypothetical protein [Mucilaginibacter sp.]